MAKRICIGDIVEISTSKGLAYAQFSHKQATHGALLRILPGIFELENVELDQLIKKTAQFSVFFPLQAAVNQNIFKIVGNYPVPESAQAFPLFRCAARDFRTGKVQAWWFWDGVKEWRVGDITADQRKLSIRGIWNDTLLIERIEAGWTPEKDSD